MKNQFVSAMVATLLGACLVGAAWAAEPPAPPPPSDTPALSTEDEAQLEAQLEAARKRLDKAAHEVAELSAEMGRPLVRKFMQLNDDPDRAIIGVQLDPASGKEGARVRDVSPGGPAAEAGVRAGDIIVAVNGTDVKGDDPARQVIKIMRNVKPDTKVNVRVLREGKAHDLTITARSAGGNVLFAERLPALSDLPDLHFRTEGGIPGLSAPLMIYGPLADMELATLTPQLGRYFGTDKGVLVVRAPKDGGFRLEDGDVILAIDGREPTSGSHATRILASYQPGEKVAIKIMREHKPMTVDTTLPEKEGRPRKMVILRDGDERQPERVIVGRGGQDTT